MVPLERQQRGPWHGRYEGRRGGGPLLELEGISKNYGPSEVLDDVSLVLRPGEIHALVGENGAGKSTLMRIAAGMVRPDRGKVVVWGKALRNATPRAARAAGVEIATQELTSVPARSVLENVFLGMRVAGFGSLRRSVAFEQFEKLCEETGFRLPATAIVRELSIADRQVLEVLRCLIRRPRVLILDEPTSSLDVQRADQLLALLRRMSKDVVIGMVSHHLQEVLSIAGTVSVLRDGKLVSTAPVGEESEASLIQKMVGRSLQQMYLPKHPPSPGAEVVLEACDIWRGDVVQGVSLSVRAGEMVGLAGLVGAGRSEFARCVIGADRCDRGTVRVAGGTPMRLRNPRAASAAGVVMAPEDRKGQGLVLERSVAENFALSDRHGAGRFGFALPRWVNNQVKEWMVRADIRPRDPGRLVRHLSGGNQQKVLLSKWLACSPKVLIADEPTRGVDVGAKAAIHQMIADAAASQIGVLLISSELEELMGLAHRVLVFRKGRLVAEFDEGAAGREAIIAAAFGTVPERASL
jgi:rhamnose transport system ATP-binding protein